MHVTGVLRMTHMKASRMAIDLIRTCRDLLRDHLPRQRNPFTSGPGTSAKQKLMPVLLDRYFLTGMESKTTKEDNNSKCSAIFSDDKEWRERGWVHEPTCFQRFFPISTCTLTMTPQKFSTWRLSAALSLLNIVVDFRLKTAKGKRKR